MKNIFLCIVLVTNSLLSIAQTTKSNKVLIPYRAKNLWGLSDTLGKIKVTPIFKEIKDFVISSEHNFASRYVVKTNKTHYVIDQNKKVFLPELNPYDSIKLDKYNYNHFWVYKKGKVGLFHNYKEILPCLYDKIVLVENKSYEVQVGKLSGLINSLGKLIIPIEYKSIYSAWDDQSKKNPKFVWIAEGLLVEKKFYDTKIIQKNSDYELKMSDKIQIIEEFADNRLDNKKNLAKKYDSFEIFGSEKKYAYVTLSNKRGVVNINTEEEIVKPIYNDVKYFATDKEKYIFKVTLNQKYGLVKEGNKVILENEFDNIENDYKTGINFLEKDNKKGCIVFNTIYPYIKPKYLSIRNIDGIEISDKWQFGLFEVTTDKGKGIVGENGVEFFND
jgi:hypothetical protein